MANIFDIDQARACGLLEQASVAFGVFDGVHRGHRYLIERACSASGRASVVLTFDCDPDELFAPERLRKLMGNDRRIATLAGSGVDAVVVVPFCEALATQQPLDFLDDVFRDAVPASIHVGADMRFGCKASGDVAELRRWAQRAGCAVDAVSLLAVDGEPVTSTRIRRLLADGSIEQANDLLGYAYTLEGTVVEGRHEGAQMGFRTANLEMPAMLQAIGEGVYAAWAHVGDVRCKAAVSVGVTPTFAERATATCEAHLLDFDEDIYGKRIGLEFRHWLRPMRTFDDIDELIATVMGNIAWVRENL